MVNNKILLELKKLDCEVINKINKKNIPLGLTQLKIINYLINNKVVYQKDLEKNLSLTRATISCVLKTMEKNKIIRREISDSDTRSKIVVLNDELKIKLEKNIDEINKIEKTLIKGISDSELEVFFNVIDKMKNNLRREENV